MAKKQVLLKYPDGSKRHINVAERDSLLIQGLAVKISDKECRYSGQPRTLHCLSDLHQLLPAFEFTEPKRKFLAGQFIRIYKQKRQKERLETPEGLAYRLGLVAP